MTRSELKEGQMLLELRKQRHEDDPIAHGWKREGEWFVGLVVWPSRSGKGYRMIEQGRERA